MDVKLLVFIISLIHPLLPPYSTSHSKLNEVTELHKLYDLFPDGCSTLQHQSELVSFQWNYVLSSPMTTDPPLNLGT